ncbi:MAG: metallophosphoesterase [Actinomycetota bacterium]
MEDLLAVSRARWRWRAAALALPPLLVFGLPRAEAQEAPASPTLIAAGDISKCGTTGAEQTAALIDSMPGTVLPLGDLAYEDGSRTDFENCYAPTWGRFRDRSRPTTGNHEYIQKGAGPYFDYWGDVAGDRTKGYYSFNIGSWHLISLNSTCSAAGGCSKGSPMETWLREDLAANRSRCILAYWHHPRFFTASRSPGGSKPPATDRKFVAMWRALMEAGADVVLSGHRHVYERFARQDAEGNATPDGIRQFVVGTGGGPLDQFEGPTAPNSELRKAGTYGVLELTLHPDRYDWRFVPVAGDTFTDSGSDTCGPAADPAPGPAPADPAPEPAPAPAEPAPAPAA